MRSDSSLDSQQSQSDDLTSVLKRVAAGEFTTHDISTIRRAIATGQVQIVSGERAVSLGAGANDTVIVTGDHNVIIYLPDLRLSKELIFEQETFEYLNSASRRWQELILEDTGHSVALTDVFVLFSLLELSLPLKLSSRSTSDLPIDLSERLENAGLEVHKNRYIDPPSPVSIAQALAVSPHLVILGEPGSGKSTTLQYIALCLASTSNGWAKEQLGLSGPYIPILLSLRDFRPDQTIRDVLCETVRRIRQCTTALAEELLDFWQRTNSLFVLIDGLDEAYHWGNARKAIADFMASPLGRQARIIISSRRTGYVRIGGMFREYLLKPLTSTEEVQCFLTRWLDQVGKPVAAAYLLSQLRQQPALRRILDNPLILRLCTEVFTERGEIVSNRASLYKMYLKVLSERAKCRGLSDKDIEVLLEAAEELAWYWHSGKAGFGSVSEKQLLELRTKLGLIVQVNDSYSFAHLTIREYFVARRLYRVCRVWRTNFDNAMNFLRPRLHLPEWREPLGLLASMLSREDAALLLDSICHAHSKAEHMLRRDLILAIALAGEHADIPVVLLSKLKSVFESSIFNRTPIMVRQAIIEALGKVADAKAIEVLKQASNDRRLREAIAVALGEIGSEEGVDTLIFLLNDPNVDVRLAVIEAMGKISCEKVVEPLIKMLSDPEWEVREVSAVNLGKIGSVNAVPALLRLLVGREPIWRVRKAAVEALKQIGDAQVVPELIHGLFDTDWQVQVATMESLKLMGRVQVWPVLTQMLHDTEPSKRRIAAKVLGFFEDKQAIPKLISALDDVDESVRLEVITALGRIGDAGVVPALVQTLSDPSVKVRRTATQALGKIKDSRVISELSHVLSNLKADVVVRRTAAQVLGNFNHEQAVLVLMQALNDPDWTVRRAAVNALGQIKDDRVLSALTNVVRDPDHSVREAAAKVLGVIGDQQVVPALVYLLKDSDPRVRQAAASSLGKIGDTQVVSDLTEVLEDIDRNVRREAVAALGKIGADYTVTVLTRSLRDDDPRVRREAAVALGKMRNAQAIQDLINTIGDADVVVRRFVIAALGQIGSIQALPALINALDDTSMEVREEAVRAIGMLDVSSIPELVKVLDDRQKRKYVVVALGEIGDAQIVPALSRLLGDSDREVRELAAELLSRILPLLRTMKPTSDLTLAIDSDHAMGHASRQRFAS